MWLFEFLVLLIVSTPFRSPRISHPFLLLFATPGTISYYSSHLKSFKSYELWYTDSHNFLSFLFFRSFLSCWVTAVAFLQEKRGKEWREWRGDGLYSPTIFYKVSGGWRWQTQHLVISIPCNLHEEMTVLPLFPSSVSTSTTFFDLHCAVWVPALPSNSLFRSSLCCLGSCTALQLHCCLIDWDNEREDGLGHWSGWVWIHFIYLNPIISCVFKLCKAIIGLCYTKWELTWPNSYKRVRNCCLNLSYPSYSQFGRQWELFGNDTIRGCHGDSNKMVTVGEWWYEVIF